MLSTPPATFRAHYKALVASGAIEADPAQSRAAEAFAALEQRLSGYTPIRSRACSAACSPTRTSRRRAGSTSMATSAAARPC